MVNASDNSPSPFLTVIVPVLDGAETLEACLGSLRRSSFQDWELIVVDDGSNDGSDQIARNAGAQVLCTAGRQGPGAARNLAAKRAQGDVLFFLDADCSIKPDALRRTAEIFQQEPDIDALFGSYDAAPSAPGVVARYKNLQHHFVHQHSQEDAQTFWAGCGAMRRSVFARLGGFDTERYQRPAIEDIELGYRLTRSGGIIRLAKDVQAKHHKAWTFTGVLRSDLFDRGIPWILLLLEDPGAGGGLNIDARGRASVVLAVIAALSLVVAPWWPWSLVVGLGAVLGLLASNTPFYRLLARRGGAKLLLAGVGMHWIYQLNCALAFLVGHVLHWRRRMSASA